MADTEANTGANAGVSAGVNTGISSGISAADIRRTAMDLLARREHSYRELIQKLSLRFTEMDLIRKAVDQLRDERLQSDYRFAETYLYSRSQRLFGPQRIKAELRERGIADDIVTLVFAEAQIDWSANQLKLLSTKFGEQAPVDFAEKAKRLRFLQYRGFNSGNSDW